MESTEIIIQMLDKFILMFGGNYGDFYVGTTDNPDHQLYEVHKIGYVIPFSYKQARDAKAASKIAGHFSAVGCDGTGSDDNDHAVFVYVYKKGPNTNP